MTLSAATRGALERLAASISALTLILIVVADAIPLLVLLVLALVQGLPTSETELIIPYIVKNFVVSFNPVLAKIGVSSVSSMPKRRSGLSEP